MEMESGVRRFITVILLLISPARCLEVGKTQLISFSTACVYVEHRGMATRKQNTGFWQG